MGNYSSGINEAVKYTAAVLLRDLKMKKLDYICKAKNITTGNLFEVFVEKFTLLTAHPSHGFSAFYNILPMNTSKFPVCGDSGITGVDWIHWRGKEGSALSPPAPPAAGSARCHPPAENPVLHLFSSWVLSGLLIPASKPRRNNEATTLLSQSRARSGTSEFPLPVTEPFLWQSSFYSVAINIGLKYLARTKFQFPSISLALFIQLSRTAS